MTTRPIRLNDGTLVLTLEAVVEAETGVRRDAPSGDGDLNVQHPDPVAAGGRVCAEVYLPRNQNPTTTELFGLSFGACYQYSHGPEDTNHRAGIFVAPNLWNRRVSIPIGLDMRVTDRLGMTTQVGGELRVGLRYLFGNGLVRLPAAHTFAGAEIFFGAMGGDSGYQVTFPGLRFSFGGEFDL